MESTQTESVTSPLIPWYKRFWRAMTESGVALLIWCCVLPSLALGLELLTGMCGNMFFDPIPTMWHIGAVAAVPLCYFVAWWTLFRLSTPSVQVLRQALFLSGFAACISFVYALNFVPLMFFGAIVFVLTIWFGVGLVAVLPFSPLIAFISGFFLRRRLWKHLEVRNAGARFYFGGGAMVVFLGFFIYFAYLVPTLLGIHWAMSEDGDTQRRGIRLLRRFGDEDTLVQFCSSHVNRRSWESVGDWLILNCANSTEAERRELYYRLTGKFFFEENKKGMMRRGRYDRAEWDDSIGGEQIGGVFSKLSLVDSIYDLRTNAESATAYGEWTLVFRNMSWRNGEARARIALPPGAVVSRLTLWINGEPCEAAFGGRKVVRQAYENVVRRNRDPVLVETCGPDVVQVQCFPVPPEGGEMRIRLGIAIPIEIDEKGGCGTIHAPAIIERNFKLSRSSLQLPAKRMIQLEMPVAEYCWTTGVVENASSIVQQTVRSVPRKIPTRLAIVVDGSRAMLRHVDLLNETLKTIPAKLETALWVANDEEAELRRNDSTLLLRQQFFGGQCNMQALNKALDWLEQKPGGILIWLHGPQPSPMGSVASLHRRMERSTARIYGAQLDEGPCKVCAGMDGLSSITMLPPVDVLQGICPVLQDLFDRFSKEGTEMSVVRERIEASPKGALAERELGVLWAAGRVRELMLGGHPVRLKEAKEFATGWQIVTPVSSAVVLESKEQYTEAGLTPVGESSVPVAMDSVPGVPEPSQVILLVVVFVIAGLAVGWRFRKEANRVTSA